MQQSARMCPVWLSLGFGSINNQSQCELWQFLLHVLLCLRARRFFSTRSLWSPHTVPLSGSCFPARRNHFLCASMFPVGWMVPVCVLTYPVSLTLPSMEASRAAMCCADDKLDALFTQLRDGRFISGHQWERAVQAAEGNQTLPHSSL